MKGKTKQIALCGIFAALYVAIMFVFSLTSIGTYAGPIAASVVLMPVIYECGKKNAILVYLAATLLSAILIPDKTLALFSLMFCWYPVVLISIRSKIKSKILSSIVKLIICYTVVPLELLFEVKILGIPTGFEAVAPWILWLIIILGGICFLLLDIIYLTANYVWVTRIRKNLK